MNKLSNLKELNPCLLENEECVVSKQDYKIKKVCFTENRGKVLFREPNGIFIIKATIYSDTYCKTVTKKIKQHVGQKEDFLKCIRVNTRIFNKFTRGEIEKGSCKRLIIEYITDSNISEEKHITYVENKDEYYTRKIINNIKNCEEDIEVPFDKKNDGSVYLVNRQDCYEDEKS